MEIKKVDAVTLRVTLQTVSHTGEGHGPSAFQFEDADFTITNIRCCHRNGDYEYELFHKRGSFPSGKQIPFGNWITISKEQFDALKSAGIPGGDCIHEGGGDYSLGGRWRD